jgi:DNA integrity scanning protein DisA with diadenylate cyclase activity
MIVAEDHGGIMLLVPSDVGTWTASLHPFPYRLAVPDDRLPRAIRQGLSSAQQIGSLVQRVSEAEMPEDLKGMIFGSLAQSPWHSEQDVRAIASLAGVDGAIVMTRDLSLVGFGAKIAVPPDPSLQVCTFGFQPGMQPVLPQPLGASPVGTRHQSAAKFINANKDSVAIVVSQDRHVSLIHWDESLHSVVIVRNAEWWT